VNCTLFNDAQAERVRQFFDFCGEIGVDGITLSPGYAYERAPDQKHFLNRRQTKNLFRDILRDAKTRKWSLAQSILFLDFLAGNQSYRCTPWSNPTRNVFGWQRPCYLLGEGYASSFKELMEATPWDDYGTGRYEKCADCMVHCGYEGTAAEDAVRHPLKALRIKLRGIRTGGEMAPEISLDRQRPARQVFERNVEAFLTGRRIVEPEPRTESIDRTA
jgi:hopanoid biosynthesis associated radical SAM protein HpnH